ncbi:MAG: nucleoside kinase [Fusobacterium sp. JB021]|nr:nucleoside kinase [Fusobacterium sp. JB020]MDP0492797.1 nucleoside kinase [Fusobacterium sp. JB021]MDP0506173.1 nucleoside kinase [Fusobacterium sp. JB019]
MKQVIEGRQYETTKLVFLKAVKDLYPEYEVELQNSLNNGSYGEVYDKEEIVVLQEEDYEKIHNRMDEIVEKDIPINLITEDSDDLKLKAKAIERRDIKLLLENCGWSKIKEVEIGDYRDYFYICPGKSTGIVRDFQIYKYHNGFILKTPMEVFDWKVAPINDTPKISKAFKEGNLWAKIMGISYAGSINKKIFDNEILELILLNETLHNKKIASIADQIIEKKDVKLITIAGPSSSGKTTFSKKLLLNLKTCGVDTLAISLDDYYIGRANVPLDENGEKDFETIEALDIKLLNENLKDLIDGKETKLPLYNFNTGERKEKTRTVKLPEGGIIIIEGIHGLNDELTKYIPRENKFKIYISCLTQINMDMHNRVHTTDVRKIRRIVRDSISRKTQGEDTLAMWHSIRKGEEKWIFPFQEDADEIFNSSLSYELCVLKPFALKELIKIGVDSPEYDEAKKLADLLSCFVTVDQSLIPTNSILKEFIGGSIFYKY